MTNEWRDYSDCAPKTNGRYLVTVKFAGKMTVYVRAYKDGAFVGDDMNVVAWMPLPEAFKEKVEERDTASFPTVSPIFTPAGITSLNFASSLTVAASLSVSGNSGEFFGMQSTLPPFSVFNQ